MDNNDDSSGAPRETVATPLTDAVVNAVRDYPNPMDALVADLTILAKRLEVALRERGYDATRIHHRARRAEQDRDAALHFLSGLYAPGESNITLPPLPDRFLDKIAAIRVP